MKKAGILYTLIILFVVASISVAQDEERWRNFEVLLDVGLTSPSGTLADWKDSLGAKTGLNFGFSGAYYFRDAFCAGVYFHYTQLGIDSDEDYGMNFKMYDVGSYFKYNFGGESLWEPYIKATIGVNSVKFPTWVTPSQRVLREQSYDPGLSLGGYLGILYYTSEFGGIFLETGFHQDPLKDTEANYRGEIYTIDDNLAYLEIKLGIAAFFGPE